MWCTFSLNEHKFLIDISVTKMAVLSVALNTLERPKIRVTGFNLALGMMYIQFPLQSCLVNVETLHFAATLYKETYDLIFPN
jgi:hypothetical protein